jgi:hypothetical protein
MAVDRRDWPVMVRIGLWGLPNRESAWAFFWLSAVAAVAFFALGWVYPIAFLGTLLAFAAWWYYLSIRWVDENSRWS